MTLNNAMRSAIVDSGWNTALGTNFQLVIKETATVLCTITGAANPFGAASNGVASKNGTWSGSISASGTANTAVLQNNAGTNTVTLTCGEAAEEVVLNESTLVSGGTVTINTVTLTQPAS